MSSFNDMSIEPITSIETETIEADLLHVVDRIERQYQDFLPAFQKEAIQNSWDARVNKKHGKNWSINFKIVSESDKKHLIIEDAGTTGMNKEGWKAFTALWKPKKNITDAGGQGQGKFILMGASKDHILFVESTDKNLSYKCRYLKDDKKDKNNNNLIISDYINGTSPLQHIGTKIWVYNVKGNFLKKISLKDYRNTIASTWWQVLQQPYKVNIFFLGQKIKLPLLPKLEQEKIILENKAVRSFGRIKRLVLQIYEEDLPELFTGVRVQRAQMMVTRLPFEVYDKEYKNRLSGYILFDEKLEPALKKIERTNHCEFTWKSPWKEIKRLIENEIDKFKNEVIPKKEKGETIDPKLHDEVIRRANQIIMDHYPELGQVKGNRIPLIPPKPLLPVRIDRLTLDKKEKVKFNEPVQPRCAVKNDSEQPKKLDLKVILKHQGITIDENEYRFKVKSKGKQRLLLSLIKLDKSYKKGKYTIRATLKDTDSRRDIHSKATSFYLETERKPVKRGFIKKIDLKRIDDPTFRNSAVKNGKITVNSKHPEFKNILNSFKDKKRVKTKQIIYLLVKIAVDEATREMLKHSFRISRENPALDLDSQINKLLKKRDSMYCEVYI